MEDFEEMKENQEMPNDAQTDEEEVCPAPETPAEVPAQEPVDYKEEMRRLKQAYKEQRKEEKRRLQEETEEPRVKTHPVRTILISVLSTILVIAILFGILTCFPSPKQSLFAHIVRKYVTDVQNPYPNQDDVTVGGQTVKPGDNVTIQVDGEYSASAVYAKASKSVVGIEVRQLSSNTPWTQATETVVSQGSGVIYSEDGMIITNHHVVEMAINSETRSLSSNYKVVVYFSTDLTEYYTATALLGYDADNDIALIKVDAKGLTPITFGNMDQLEVGQPVMAIGSPGGLEFMNSLSEGIVSGLDRDITSFSNGVTVYELIQTTAAINPGNSGGALLDREGNLIGICVIKIVSESYEGMGFAINVDTVQRIVDSFLKYGRYVKPVLGVEVNTLYDAEAADSKGWPVGAYVSNITFGGAAARAGIRSNDIICEIGGERITKFSQLRKYLLRYGPEDTITVKIFRTTTQEYMDMTVKLNASE